MAPRFCILGTGSSGNSALLETEQTRVLIDAGFSARKLAQLLESVGRSLEQVHAVFLTHEHGDHAAAIDGLKRHPHIEVFANAPTARAVQDGLKHKVNWKLFETGSHFRFRDLEIDAFSVPHDARDPVGFRFSCASEAAGPDLQSAGAQRPVPPSSLVGTTLELDLFSCAPAASAATTPTAPVPSPAPALVWLTDLGYAPAHLHAHLRDCDALIIEANHCPELLRADTKRPWSTKQRIAGRHGHLSNPALAELLASVASPRWHHVFLTHLSRDCNSPAAIDQALAPIKARLNCAFAIASQDSPTEFIEL